MSGESQGGVVWVLKTEAERMCRCWEGNEQGGKEGSRGGRRLVADTDEVVGEFLRSIELG